MAPASEAGDLATTVRQQFEQLHRPARDVEEMLRDVTLFDEATSGLDTHRNRDGGEAHELTLLDSAAHAIAARLAQAAARARSHRLDDERLGASDHHGAV